VTAARDRIRERVQAFVDLHADDEAIERAWASGTLHDPAIHRALAAEGLIGAMWPVDLGGAGLSPIEAGHLWEAMNYHRLPIDLLELTEMAAYVLIETGSPEQRASILPRVREGSLLISLGYTEPGAGSDVAAAATRAVKDGDHWRINGAKMFTTGAHVADLIFVLVRTDPDAAKHAGLSLFLVPRRTPGVSVRPVHTFGGERTNAVFLDDVIVPSQAMVGEAGAGWAILNTALDFERQVMAAYSGQARRLLDDLVGDLTRTGRLRSPVVRDRLAGFRVRLAAAQALTDEVGHRAELGLEIDVCAAMAKLAATEVFKDLSYAALDLAGPPGLLRPGRLEHWFRHAQIATIYGGSNEIQRNIIARRRLDLPRA
jgi:alkylation response protein AidB-like acyl-CoA dehydrogenase